VAEKKLPVTAKIDRATKGDRFITRLELQTRPINLPGIRDELSIEILSVVDTKRTTILNSKAPKVSKIEEALNALPPQTIISNEQQITTTLVHNRTITTRPLRIASPPEVPKPIPTPNSSS
jgi:hypothetical protein